MMSASFRGEAPRAARTPTGLDSAHLVSEWRP
jgi:hypothetical protein